MFVWFRLNVSFWVLVLNYWHWSSLLSCPVNSPHRESRKYTLFFVFGVLVIITYTECSREILRSGRWAGGVITDTAHLGPASQDSKRTPRVDRMPISFWIKEKRVCRLFYKKYIGINWPENTKHYLTSNLYLVNIHVTYGHGLFLN